MKRNAARIPLLTVIFLIFVITFGQLETAGSLAQLPQPLAPTYLGPSIQVSPSRFDECHRFRPQAAFNYIQNEYLVVWHCTWSSGTRQIIAQRLDITGNRVGSYITLSSALFDSVHPNVAYNHTNGEYFVVWMRDVSFSGDNTRYEIWGAILPWNVTDIPTPFKISHLNSPYNTWYPSVAWNSVHNAYLVIWDTYLTGNPPVSPQSIDHRNVTSTGSPGASGTISSTGVPAESDLTYNPSVDEYLVVWTRLSDSAYDNPVIFGKLLNNSMGVEKDDFLIGYDNPENHNPAVTTDQQSTYYIIWEEPSEPYDIFGYKYLDVGGDSVSAGSWGTGYEGNHPDAAYSGRASDLLAVYNERNFPNSSTPNHRIRVDINLSQSAGWDTTYIYKPDWVVRNPAVVGGDDGFLIVYEGRPAGAGTYQHIYASKFWQHGVFLPLVLK